ncbi:MAG: hypothetical protein MI741_10280 [Rhodospirillales bacterium]|nr:hypothetical protein [Rhodospirillales bacterium]
MTDAEKTGRYDDFQQAFFDAFTDAGAPEGAAMFVSNTDVYDGYFYFTPEAAKLFAPALEGRNPRPCVTPPRSSVAYLVGNGDPSKWFAE